MITVEEWMSKPVITVDPRMNIYDVVKLMNKKHIGSVVVSDDGIKAKGILTERDIMSKVIGQKLDPETTQADKIMTKKVMTVKLNTSLLEISKIMSKNELRRIVVVENNKMVGIVTSRDLLQLMA